VGWHTFTEPTDEQRLTRMIARRAARTPDSTKASAEPPAKANATTL
jgi:hypothetical protein